MCFLSNPQNLDISHLLSSPIDSPFAKALAHSTHVLAVPNCVCSIYSRLWCVYEAFLAYTWNKPITTATALRGNWLAHLLKVKFIHNSVLHASLLLPLRWGQKFRNGESIQLRFGEKEYVHKAILSLSVCGVNLSHMGHISYIINCSSATAMICLE